MKDAAKARPSAVSLLCGELDERAAEELLARAERDEEASGELDLVADLVVATENERAWLSSGSPAKRRSLWPVALIGGLAAAAALLLGPQLLHTRSAIQPLEAPVYVPAQLRAPGEELARSFSEAMRPYAEGDQAASVASLAAFLDEQPEHGPARFWHAVSLEQLGRLEEARSEYRSVRSGREDYLGDHASWRLAHLHLLEGDEERAREILAELVDSGRAFATNAAYLLDELGR